MDTGNQTRGWQGYPNLRYLFIFGASSSSVGFRIRSPDPTDENPLGVRFPGTTYCERSNPNWVGYIIAKYAQSKLLVYDYAVGGHRVEGVVTQIRHMFLETVGQPDKDGVLWNESNSLFVIWAGGNDSALTNFDASERLTLLFEWVLKLYETDARNFLFLNVPPLPRLDSEESSTAEGWTNRMKRGIEWNDLPQFLSTFTTSHPDASVFLFDVHKLFSDMFAEPTKYGFMEGAGVQFDEVILCVFGVVFILATAQAKFKHSGQLQEEPLAVQDLVLGGKGGSKDPAVQSGSWRGYESLKHVFVFGDSYSSVGFESGVSKPTPDMPLGVPWPGKTYCGPREPNWVGHLSVSYNKSGFLVYDYAVGGHTVTDVADQVRLRFLVNEGDKMKEAIKWAAADSLFVTWVGTNDVAYANFDAKRSVRYLFTLQQELYRAGARNFLLLNVPPLPLPMSKASETHPQLLARIRRCTDWNNMLSKLIDTFVEQHQGSSVFLFDAHACFERMFNDPPKYGFPKGSGKAYDKHMYVDHIHPSSGMHKVIAEELAAFLNGGK